jgi:acyl-CoA thioesterase-1
MNGFSLAGLILVGTLLIGGAFWYFFGESPVEQAGCRELETQPTIAAFGDSIITGQGATTPGGFIGMLSTETGIPIQNFGKGGDTSAAALSRVDTVLAAVPDIVVILLGGNDALRRVPPATTEANLDAIMTRFTEAGTEVVLVGIIGDLFNDPYAPMFERLAAKHDAEYVPNVYEGIFGRNEYMSDAIHPNEAGYAIIADRVLPALNAACAK